MLHARDDYHQIQDPRGKIPEDEPVFLLRGQDMCAPGVVRTWAAYAEMQGAKPDIVGAAKQQADRMEAWQREYGSKVPDLPQKASYQGRVVAIPEYPPPPWRRWFGLRLLAFFRGRGR